jgi:hypothetical protein
LMQASPVLIVRPIWRRSFGGTSTNPNIKHSRDSTSQIWCSRSTAGNDETAYDVPPPEKLPEPGYYYHFKHDQDGPLSLEVRPEQGPVAGAILPPGPSPASGSLLTRCWRETDSNFRFPERSVKRQGRATERVRILCPRSALSRTAIPATACVGD